ncbi:murein hydrolase activator EnvC family protein [Amycolatopsis sp. NPDC059027]|uniref:murein hydrolase activator EnvC family protein n=1 Tax=unclassified Amycolatopsis TaxID=2618356 RepID=UPI00366F7127
MTASTCPRIRLRPMFALLVALFLGFAGLVAPPATAASKAGPRLSWPLSPVPKVTRYFDAPGTPFGPGHRGVDLAAAPGQQVLTAAEGVVVFAGVLAGRGVVSVDHDGGLRTTYEPVTPSVSAGEQVYRGQPLGTVVAGHPGCTVAACLHWGVRRGHEYLDPLALTGEQGEIRLKPYFSREDALSPEDARDSTVRRVWPAGA